MVTTEEHIVDVHIAGGGSVYLVIPLTDAAREWIEENVGGETTWFGDGLAVEHGYIDDLVDGMAGDGLVIA